MRRIRIAQIGTSKYSHGNSIFKTLIKLNDCFEIAGYAMPEGEKEKFPENMSLFSNYKEMTVDEIMNDKSIEAVAIETEEIYLTKYALEAAKNKKHIHMEKPGGCDSGEFEKLIEAVRKNKLVFHTGYMYRYNPVISELIREAKIGELGDIISIEADMSCFHTDEAKKWLKTFKGGMMFFLGCHLIDIILRIQGKPEEIIPFNTSTGINEIDSEDFGMVVFKYKKGVSFAKTSASKKGGYARRNIIVTGTKKTVEICPTEMFSGNGMQYTEYIECTGEDWAAVGERKRSEEYDRYESMMKSYAEMVRGEKENPYSYDYELELYKTVLKCCK